MIRIQDAQELQRNGLHLSATGMIGIGFAILATVAGLVATTAVIVRRRSKSYKRSSRNGKGLAEDSDVRYLTSDEMLDFTMARPNEDT